MLRQVNNWKGWNYLVVLVWVVRWRYRKNVFGRKGVLQNRKRVRKSETGQRIGNESAHHLYGPRSRLSDNYVIGFQATIWHQ